MTKNEKETDSAGLGLKELSACRECTCFNLRKATRVVTQFFDDRMRPFDLRGTQFALLAHTYAMGPVAMTKLAEMMVTDRTTLARNLDPLVKSGLINVEHGDDRRKRIISITAEGRKRMTEAYPVWKETQEEVQKMMGHDHWSSMMSEVSNLVDRIQEK